MSDTSLKFLFKGTFNYHSIDITLWRYAVDKDKSFYQFDLKPKEEELWDNVKEDYIVGWQGYGRDHDYAKIFIQMYSWLDDDKDYALMLMIHYTEHTIVWYGYYTPETRHKL